MKIAYSYYDPGHLDCPEFCVHQDDVSSVADLEETVFCILQQLVAISKTADAATKEKLEKLVKDNILWDCDLEHLESAELVTEDELDEDDDDDDDDDDDE